MGKYKGLSQTVDKAHQSDQSGKIVCNTSAGCTETCHALDIQFADYAPKNL